MNTLTTLLETRSSEESLNKEWQDLQRFSAALGRPPLLPEHCRHKDRFIDIQPSENRVVLTGSSHYINADLWRPNRKGDCNLILTQAPLNHTRVDFARMLAEQNANLVISLTWPDTPDEDYLNFVDRFEGQRVSMTSEVMWSREIECIGKPRWVSGITGEFYVGENLTLNLYKCELTAGEESKQIRIVRVHNWPDRHMPSQISDVIELV